MAMMPEFYDALVSGDDAGDSDVGDVSSVLVTLHSMHILSSDVLPLLGARDLAVLACVSKEKRSREACSLFTTMAMEDLGSQSSRQHKGTGYSERPGKVMKQLCGTDTSSCSNRLKIKP